MTKRALIVLAAGAAALGSISRTALAGTTTVTPAHMDGWAAVHDMAARLDGGDRLRDRAWSRRPDRHASLHARVERRLVETLRTAPMTHQAERPDGVRLLTYGDGGSVGRPGCYIDLYVTTEPRTTSSPSSPSTRVGPSRWPRGSTGTPFGDSGGPTSRRASAFTTLSAYHRAHPNAIIRNDARATSCWPPGAAAPFLDELRRQRRQADDRSQGRQHDLRLRADGRPADRHEPVQEGGWRSQQPELQEPGPVRGVLQHHNGKVRTTTRHNR